MITLQYFDGCPNWKIVDATLKDLIEQQGLDVALEYQLIDSPEAALANEFHGSPTIRIDNIDPFSTPDAPVGLSCRIYQTPTGPAGAPSVGQLAAALDHMPRTQGSRH